MSRAEPELYVPSSTEEVCAAYLLDAAAPLPEHRPKTEAAKFNFGINEK